MEAASRASAPLVDERPYVGIALSVAGMIVTGETCNIVSVPDVVTDAMTAGAFAAPQVWGVHRRRSAGRASGHPTGAYLHPSVLVVTAASCLLFIDTLVGVVVALTGDSSTGASLRGTATFAALGLAVLLGGVVASRSDRRTRLNITMVVVVAFAVRSFIILLFSPGSAEGSAYDDMGPAIPLFILGTAIAHLFYLGAMSLGALISRRRSTPVPVADTLGSATPEPPPMRPSAQAATTTRIESEPGWYLDTDPADPVRHLDGDASTASSLPLDGDALGPRPGWWPDPSQEGVLRWWNGQAWTDRRRHI